MKTSEKIIILIALVIVVTIEILTLITPSQPKKFGGSVNYVPAQVAATSTAVTVTTASTLVLATSTRNSCFISNDSGRTVYLSFTGLAATANAGYVLQASTTLSTSNEIATGYYGAIFGISPGGNANVTSVCF